MSQTETLLHVLKDCYPHRTDEIVRRVYGVGEGTWLARVGARVFDLKRKGYSISSWPDDEERKLWWYRLNGYEKPVKPVVEAPIQTEQKEAQLALF